MAPGSSRLTGGGGSETTPKRRRLTTKTGPNSPSSSVNVWDPHQDIEAVFSDCHGAARIERIFDVFGDPRGESMDIDWFSSDGRPNVISDPLNRPLQLATVTEYEQRIFDAGLADDCSGGLYLLSFVFRMLWF